VLPGPADEGWMRDVAREMNLSETAFLHRVPDGFALRWFTPTVEVDLCGHATLASAHVLWQDGHLDPLEPARFHTRSGLLTAKRGASEILLDFPATPPVESPRPAGLAEALGVMDYRWRNPVRSPGGLTGSMVIAQPDMSALGNIERRGSSSAVAYAGQPHDFVSRFFAPASGVPEDPVTGSAHCALGPYWRARIGRDRMVGYQASARGGTVSVTCLGDRVMLGGTAVVTHRTLLLQ
jgi:PhzF family phenazine biosynthesis protein